MTYSNVISGSGTSEQETRSVNRVSTSGTQGTTPVNRLSGYGTKGTTVNDRVGTYGTQGTTAVNRLTSYGTKGTAVNDRVGTYRTQRTTAVNRMTSYVSTTHISTSVTSRQPTLNIAAPPVTLGPLSAKRLYSQSLKMLQESLLSYM